MRHKFIKLILALSCIFVSLAVYGQQPPPAIAWQKCLGGSSNDLVYQMISTNDGGYLLVGISYSDNGDVSNHHGSTNTSDCWVIKLSNTGNIEWQKSLGGTLDDAGNSAYQTTDNGYIIAGTSLSNDGDVSGHHGSADSSDFWVVKLNQTGNIEWQHSYGGTNQDAATSVFQLTGGGYIVAGESYSNNGDVVGYHAPLDTLSEHFSDFWVIRIDSSGQIKWSESIGGSSYEAFPRLVKTGTDNSFLVSGSSFSSDGDITDSTNLLSCWMFKLASNGQIAWRKNIGAESYLAALDTKSTLKNGFVVGGGVGGEFGSDTFDEFQVFKTDSAGNPEWQWNLPSVPLGAFNAYISSVLQLPDSSFITGGDRDDGTSNPNTANSNLWINKLDKKGKLIWQKKIGGSRDDTGPSVLQASDRGFILAANSNSNDGEATGNHGGSDILLIKLQPELTGGYIFNGNGKWTDRNNWLNNILPPDSLVAGETVTIDPASNGQCLLDRKQIAQDGSNIIIRSGKKMIIPQNLDILKSGKCILGGYQPEVSTEVNLGNQSNVNFVLPLDNNDIIAVGTATQDTNDVKGTGYKGFWDCWIARINASGSIVWKKSLGGSNKDLPVAALKDKDGNICLALQTSSNDGDIPPSPATWLNDKLWTLKISPEGTIFWNKVLAFETGSIQVNAAAINGNGEMVIACDLTASSSADLVTNYGFHNSYDAFQRSDAFVVKLSAVGSIIWAKCFGGSGSDGSKAIAVSTDGTIFIGGDTQSDDGDITGRPRIPPTVDGWLFQLSAAGQLLQQKFYSAGFYFTETGCSIRFVAAAGEGGCYWATFQQANGGDLGIQKGNIADGPYSDTWIFKTDPSLKTIWKRNIGGSQEDRISNIFSDLSDSSLRFSGFSGSNDFDFDCKPITPSNLVSGFAGRINKKGSYTLNQFFKPDRDVYILDMARKGSRIWTVEQEYMFDTGSHTGMNRYYFRRYLDLGL